MNKPLLLSLATATLLGTNLNADSMYERIQSMEMKMKQMQNEITTLKAEKSQAEDDDESESVALLDEDIEENDSEDDDSDTEDEDDAEDDEEESVEEQLIDIQESITELNKATNGSHLKLGVDYRFAVDNLNYTMADGSKQGNDALLTNRLWINMNWRATDNLSFSGQIAYNKAFGARSGVPAAGYETFDWITNENAYDDVLRVRSAYFLYKNDTFMGTEIPWTFSIGRRPSTNGHLVNLRDDDGAASPMGHTINVEFDGLSSKFALEDVIGVDGMYVKFCAGRGGTNAVAKFTRSGTPYATTENDVPNIDLGGLIFVPYNDGQYGIATQYYYAGNLIDQDPTSPVGAFETVGGLHSFTANITMNGIGDEWSDYLDDTFFFMSGAISISNPDDDKVMFSGAPGESVTGYSAWVGLQMPSVMTEEGRWGLEYNKGTANWRSITYAEDTNVGSKLAARGDAYEVYFTEPLIEDILTLQVRYTYIDYKYTGSNGFFGGSSGRSVLIESLDAASAANVVDKAQDIRFYLRYRY